MMTYLGKNHRETYSNPPLVVTDLILVIGVRKCGTGRHPVTGKMPVAQVLLLKWKHSI